MHLNAKTLNLIYLSPPLLKARNTQVLFDIWNKDGPSAAAMYDGSNGKMI